MNRDLGNAVEKYRIEFDSYNFFIDQEWYNKIDKTEDILQISHTHHEGPIIDLGWYVDCFKIYVIANQNWAEPLECISVKSSKQAAEIIYSMIERYADGVDKS